MPTTISIPSILVYPLTDYRLVYHMGLSLVHCSYLSIGSLHHVSYPVTQSPLQNHFPFIQLWQRLSIYNLIEHEIVSFNFYQLQFPLLA